MDAYHDSFNTIWKSTDTFQLETWDVLGASYTWVSNSSPVKAFWTVWDGSTWTVRAIEWSLKDYTDLIYQEGRLRAINEVLDNDIEQFMVWPATGPCPIGWKGWGSKIVNGKVVAAVCP